MSIAKGFVQQARSYPDRLAILVRVDSQRSIGCCYGELLNLVQQIASAIAALAPLLGEASPDEASLDEAGNLKRSAPPPSKNNPPNLSLQNSVCVGLLLPNRVEFLEIFLGVALGGGVAIVLDPRWSSSQIHQVLQDYPLNLLFVDATLLPKLGELPKAMQIVVIKPDFSKCGAEQTQSGSVRPGSNFYDYTQWRDRPQATCKPIVSIAENSPFYVGFTSGTTSQAKGVVRSHRSWLNSFSASQLEFGTHMSDRIFIPGSLVHSLSLYAALEGLNAGATVYLLPQFNAKATLECVQTHAITMLVAVPTLLGTIAKIAANRQQIFASLRVVIAGGSTFDPHLRTQLSYVFPQADILSYFGALELSFIALNSSREPIPPQSVGRPFQTVTVSIRRQDGVGEAAIGEVGWIGVKSPMLSLGYFYGSDAVGYRVIDGWATVGDLGWQDANGYLYLVGREQDMLISSGINIYPAEIEAALRNLTEIDEAVVFGLPDADRGQVVVAAIQWTDQPLTRSELQQRLQATLPQSKCPRYYFSVDRFPRTNSGKIIRAALREQILAELQP